MREESLKTRLWWLWWLWTLTLLAIMFYKLNNVIKSCYCLKWNDQWWTLIIPQETPWHTVKPDVAISKEREHVSSDLFNKFDSSILFNTWGADTESFSSESTTDAANEKVPPEGPDSRAGEIKAVKINKYVDNLRCFKKRCDKKKHMTKTQFF